MHAIVLEIAEQIGADIKAVDIDRVHRVGKPQNIELNDKKRSDTDETTPKDPLRGREIIVKFQSHHARMNLLKGRINLRRAKVICLSTKT